MLKIPFFRLGSWRHPKYGVLQITQELMDKMMANFKAGLPGSKPYVRLGHDKDLPEAKATFGDTPALAWVTDLVQEGSVLYGLAEPADSRVVEWVRTKQYRFASAEYEPNHISRETGQPVGPVLSAIGLTNEPFLTRLPEAVVLAAPAETFYLDCEEGRNGMKVSVMEFVKRLAAGVGVELEGVPDSQEVEIAQLRAQLAAERTQQQQLAKQAETERKARREAEVDKLASDLVREGIPPAMINQVRPLLLTDTGAVVGRMKLANETEKDATQSDLIVQALRELPESQRVLFGQAGGQDEGSKVAKLAKTAEEDVRALGGTVTPDGKFKL